MEYYRNNVADSLQDVQSSANGLTSAEVDNRLKDYGFNELKGKKKILFGSFFLKTSKTLW